MFVYCPFLLVLFNDARLFLSYLPNQQNSSRHTIRAYQNSIDRLVEFVAKHRDIRLWDMDFPLIDSNILSEFLDSLEKTGNSISTGNQRLKGIRAFYSYCVMIHPALMNYRTEICKVPFKKAPLTQTIDYLSEDAVKTLLAVPDAGPIYDNPNCIIQVGNGFGFFISLNNMHLK